jgi:hypothetical protein
MRLVSFLTVVLSFSATAVCADEPSLFDKKVVPLLQQRCVSCHHEAKKRGGLDLTVREKMLAGGDTGPALVVGAADKSLLIELVTGADAKMPKQGPKLTKEEIDVLRQWIDGGAVWTKGVTLVEQKQRPADTDWWSLRPLVQPAAPEVKNKAWVRTPIDAFILATLEAKGLTAAPAADKRTLIRRLTYDLHGLPPTPEEVDAFLKDESPDAYEKLVDRLLASPRYGERWGRYWLDIVHYGDTHGYDKDKRRDHAWPYRDYVIRSFNADKGYTRFLKEQIAGDVLYKDEADGIVATGFIAAGPWDFVGQVELREGTVEKEKTRLLDRDDMVSNTIATFASLTIHCARCHDHKFDPIPQKDYYRLQAVFAGVDRGDRAYLNPTKAAQRTKLLAEKEELQKQRTDLQARVRDTISPELGQLDDEIRKLTEQLTALPKLPKGAASPSNGYHSEIAAKADVVKWVQLDLGQTLPLDEIRLLPARPTDFRDTPGFGFPARFRVDVSDDPKFEKFQTVLDHTKADFPNPGVNVVRLTLKEQKARFIRVTATRLWLRTNDYAFALAELQAFSQGKNVARTATVTALDSIDSGRWHKKYLIDDFDSRQRLPDLSDATIAAQVKERLDLQERVQERSAARQQLADKLLKPELQQALADNERVLAALDRQLSQLTQGDQVYAVLSHTPRPINVLNRGDVEQKRDLVNAGALSCVSTLDPNFPETTDEGKRRAALADWLVDAKNPLTWRSLVNRVWHGHFGRGLVDTPNDFGRNGSRPTHPELLDWLAVEFRDHGASLKQLHRLIVTSAVYRQSSKYDAANAQLDADNRYLWRMNRTRLDAESVRDSVLAISGKLDLTMGGPGFELFRFKDDHSPIYDHTALEKIHDPATYRRTVYRFTVRSVPNPFLDSLDCADPNINTPVRNTTLTALQALALLNDPFMVRQAEYFAERVQKSSDDTDKQIEMAYRLALGRLPKEEERTALAAYAKKYGLAKACRLLFNANEFVFVD